MIDPRIVANYVLDYADARGKELTNIDLQKIVYFLHGHHIKKYGVPMVRDEFEAWTYGPVHRVIYDSFKSYNDTAIDGRATAFDPVRRQRKELPCLSEPKAIAIAKEFLDHYLKIPTFDLVELTHGQGSPWSKTVEASQNKVLVGMKISNDLIAKHFEGAELETAV